MNFDEPFGGIIIGARGAVLGALMRTGTPLTGRQVHALVGNQHSLGAVQQALRDLAHLGLTLTETVGRSGLHRINENHVATDALRGIANPLDLLAQVARQYAQGAQAVIVFGSIARSEAHRGSDVDLAVIAPRGWVGRVELEDAVRDRLGNDCDVLHLTPGELAAPHPELIVKEILRDGIALVGDVPRRRTRRAS